MNNQNKIICSRCVFDNQYIPFIKFNSEGVCNYCIETDNLINRYGTGLKKGEDEFEKIISRIKKDGKNKKYDCVIGVSGGTDSSYMVYVAKELYGLRPLAVHLDNTFNTSIATENIRKVLNKLDVDLITHVVDKKEAEDIYRSFFKAGVIDFECLLDIGVPQLLYSSARKYGVKYQLEGHSFVAESISPLNTMYADGKYISSVHKKFGKLKMKTFPNMTFFNFLKWVAIYKIEKIRPFWYLPYSKEEARKILKDKFDWQDYGGHHLENRSTAFQHSVLGPRKFNLDTRANSLAASVRNKKISRSEALEELEKTPLMENQLIDYLMDRLDISNDEFDKIMSESPKTWRDYPTYKKRFERMRPFFKILLDRGLIPESFYMKYCFPFKEI